MSKQIDFSIIASRWEAQVMENLNLEQLLEIENQTMILSYIDFIETCKSNLTIFQLLHLLNNTKDGKDPLGKLYTEYRIHGLIYQTVDGLYSSLLDDLVAVIDDTKIEKDPLSLSILIGDYLIPVGLLSYTTTFHCTGSMKLFSTSEDYYFHHYGDEGKYVFCGYGCCRHIISFVSDIFNRMGIINDKVICYSLEVENIIPSLKKEINPDHVILGYILNNQYYLTDINNHIYNLSVESEYVEKRKKEKLVLDYTMTNIFQDSFHWSFDIPYGFFTEEEVMESRKNLELCLSAGDYQKFLDFKKDHLDAITKIAYLLPIELNRNNEKEQSKQKGKKIQI